MRVFFTFHILIKFEILTVCPPLSAPENGALTVNVPLIIGTTATYSCFCSLVSGDLERYCRKDLTWSGTEPVCLTGNITYTVSVFRDLLKGITSYGYHNPFTVFVKHLTGNTLELLKCNFT